jgi:hypothetical protein
MFRPIWGFKENFEIFSYFKQRTKEGNIRPVLSKLLSASFSGYLLRRLVSI